MSNRTALDAFIETIHYVVNKLSWRAQHKTPCVICYNYKDIPMMFIICQKKYRVPVATLSHFRWPFAIFAETGVSKIRIMKLKSKPITVFLGELAKQHIIINQVPTTIVRNIFFLDIKSIKIHGIPWNFEKFRGILWNSMELSGKNDSSIEFHGTFEKCSLEFHRSLKLNKIPWNSVKLQLMLLRFHGIPWNYKCCSNVVE